MNVHQTMADVQSMHNVPTLLEELEYVHVILDTVVMESPARVS